MGCCCSGGSEACLPQTRLKEQKEQHALLLHYQAGLLQSESKKQPLGEVILFFPCLWRIYTPFVRASPCHKTTAAYSNSHTELSEIYGKYKDVTINDPSLKALHIKYIVYIKWARFRLQVFESVQGPQDEKTIRGKSCWMCVSALICFTRHVGTALSAPDVLGAPTGRYHFVKIKQSILPETRSSAAHCKCRRSIFRTISGGLH